MKFANSAQKLISRNIEKEISKKILLANTADKTNTKELGVAQPASPIYFQNSSKALSTGRFSADVRYRNNYANTTLNNIYHRNNLILFAENNEIKKAITAIENEIIVQDLKENKYPVYPIINYTQVEDNKLNTAKAIQEYIDGIFYPKLIQMLGWRKPSGLSNIIRDYLIQGKVAYEIVYDNLQRPKEIVNIVPIDTTELSKVKEGDYVFYIQKPLDGGKERVLHENQVILIEWNEYDFGHQSYVETLKRAFNIMRGMQTSKILWFAVKSQVRMHINLNLGDISRDEAISRINVSKDDFINNFDFDSETGEIFLNDEPSIVGYKEFFTAETANSGTPSIEEINTNGPDLTEVDSLQFWEKLFWKETQIPYDRIDPSSQDSWSFLDSTSIRKAETGFARFIDRIRDKIAECIIKPITIQLTLKEVEIGVDLSLLDQIKIEWVAFNQYDEIGNLEVVQKRSQIIGELSQFAQVEDAEGRMRSYLPINWLVENFLELSNEQLKSIQRSQDELDKKLGFATLAQTAAEALGEESSGEEEMSEEEISMEEEEESAEDIANFEDESF